MKNISMGGDPEFMVRSPEGKLVSAIGIVPGTKEERYSLGDGHAAYYDNVLAEVQIRPGFSKEEVVASFRECLTRVAKLISPHRLTVQASATYPKSECEHKDAKLFGCSPELCAYDVCVINPPDAAKNTFRSAGGHVHIGYDGGADVDQGDLTQDEWDEVICQIAWQRIWVVRMCDLFLGIPSLLLDKDPTSAARRKLYGGAGTHRGCAKYGVEYRALSDFWLARPSSVELVYDLATVAVKTVMEDRVHERIWGEEIDPQEMRMVINTADTTKVGKFMKVIEKYVPADVLACMKTEQDKGYLPNLSQWGIET
jgi:hypothetical protein